MTNDRGIRSVGGPDFGLECDTCGSFPARAGLLTVEHLPGDRCPATYLDDYDCDGKLVTVPPNLESMKGGS